MPATLALLGVVEIGEARVVELEICAAELTEALHLIPVRSRQVVPELLDIRVDVLADRRPAAPGSGPCSETGSSFGVVVVVMDFSASNASPKIVVERPTRPWTLRAAAVELQVALLVVELDPTCSSAWSMPSSW